MGTPPIDALLAILSPSTRVYRRVDIYESDNVTPWMLDAPLVSGSVNVDLERDERRTLEIEFDNSDGSLSSTPSGFWYDKIIKPYRGVYYRNSSGQNTFWRTKMGEFLIDEIDAPRFPRRSKVKGRDFTKKLLNDEFPTATSFDAGNQIENLVEAIALNAGITKFNLPDTGQILLEPMLFESGTKRWQAIKEIASTFGWDVYFDPDGFLAMSEFQDPIYSPEQFEFATGPGGTLVEFNKRTNDTRIKNHIIVRSENANGLQVFAEAENNQPDSPTRIEKLGRRSDSFESSVLQTELECQELANKLLKISALESFDLNFESLVLPWLDVGHILKFVDPNPSQGDPDRYLMSTLNLPLRLGAMFGLGRRVTLVG